MVDDTICVSECGFKTSMVNSYMRLKTNSKKLQFGVSKCAKKHIGKYCEEFKCQNLRVDDWDRIRVNNDETGKMKIVDVEEIMEEKEDIGDILSKDGKNSKNIKARVSKEIGIVNRIMTLLNGIPFGKFYFEVSLMLRNSLLVSSVLCNSESWYNVTN